MKTSEELVKNPELDRGGNMTGKELDYLELRPRARRLTDRTVDWVG